MIETTISVAHKRKHINFYSKLFGEDCYYGVHSGIQSHGLLPPNMGESISLGNHVLQNRDNVPPDIQRGFFSGLGGFTGVLPTLNRNGFYIQDNPKILGRMPCMEESELEDMLRAGNPSVRFVEYGFKTGDLSPIELSRNPFVIALVGEDGAEKAAKMAETLPKPPFLGETFDTYDDSLVKAYAVGIGGSKNFDKNARLVFYTWALNRPLPNKPWSPGFPAFGFGIVR